MREDKHPCIHDICDLLPITKEVMKYKKLAKHRFHTPGHKGKGHFLAEILDLSFDVTEVSDLDNLLMPTGCIKKSLENIRLVFKAKKAYMITSGATTGILAAVYSVKDFGKVAILRSSHVSVYNACEIANVEPYIIDNVDNFGNTVKITPKLLEKALNNKKVGSILLTYPDYDGNAFDIEEIANLVKMAGKKLLIDCSHGTHFVFSDLFPKSCEKYADVWVCSAHKTLPVLTGGALLLVGNEQMIGRVEKAYRLFHTTSPNYQLMMSMEYGVYMYSHYKEEFAALKKAVDSMKKTLHASDVYVLENDDFTRLVIDCAKMGISGKELDMRLQEKGIFCEYSSTDKVVFILTFEDDKEDLVKITSPIIISAQQCGQINRKRYLFPKRSKAKISYLKARKSDCEYLSPENSVGRICANAFGTYPPCLPICLPGEIITEEMVEFLESEFDFYGLYNGKICVVKDL
ncbi:MAG: DegT/DnrJ/EryC1/StrS family aminotransferase [Clostridia bacterium]|nr:DegT/DnrJ/EryC1/StrS family aminotransferase [Clostridia bacterium]